MKIFWILLVVTLTFVLLQYTVFAGQIKYSEDPDLMEQQIYAFIPVGSSIKDAKKFLEKNGCKCEYFEKTTFVVFREDENARGRVIQTLHKDKDFLSCDKHDGFIVYRTWFISVVHKDGIVENVYVSTGLTGP